MRQLINRILAIVFCLYLLLATWALFNPRELMSSNMLILSSLISFSYFWVIGFSTSILSRKNILLWGLGVVFSIFWLIQLKEIYLLEIGRFFGEGMDIKYYEGTAIRNMDTSILDFKQVLSREILFDDWGFFSLIYVIYSLGGSLEGGRIIMIIANTLAVVLSSVYLYKILVSLGWRQITIRVIVSIFLFSPFNIVVTSVGLKENFFVLLIILSLYAIIEFLISKRAKYVYLALLFSGLCLFFRPPVAVMLILTLATSALITEQNKSTIIRFGVISAVLVLPFFGLFLQTVFGIPLDQILSVTNHRFKSIGAAEMGWSINLIAALIGPFPNFTRSDTYGIYYSAVLLLKLLLGVYFYIGVYRVWKTKHILYIPLILYWLLSSTMYVFAGVGLDYRYQITVFPIWLCFVGLGLELYQENKKQTYRYFILLYTIFVLLVTMLYNVRGNPLI